MSNEYDDDQDDDGLDEAPQPQPSGKGLRAFAEQTQAENRKLAEELAALRKEHAFSKAGIDSASPLGKFFVDKYDGELTPEAVKAAWEQLAPTSAPATAPTAPAAPDPQDMVGNALHSLQVIRGGDPNLNATTPARPIDAARKAFIESGGTDVLAGFRAAVSQAAANVREG